jgi:hypothetical protein
MPPRTKNQKNRGRPRKEDLIEKANEAKREQEKQHMLQMEEGERMKQKAME